MTIKKPIIKILFTTILLISACSPPSIEQQVEKIIESQDFEKRKEIAYSLAETCDIYPLELLIGLYSNSNSEDAIKHMIIRYSQIIQNEPSNTKRALNCISFITEPSFTQQKDEILIQKKIDFIIHGLKIKNSSLSFQKALAISAKEIGKTARIQIINEWFRNKTSKELLYAISFFQDKAISYLTNDIRLKIVSQSYPFFSAYDHKDPIDLLVEIGEYAVNPLIDLIHEEEFGQVRESYYHILLEILNENPEKSDQIISVIDNKVRNYLIEDISDSSAMILLARIGDPIVAKMKKLMKNKDQSIRFAAGEVLVKMLKYHPESLESLTSAIDSESTRIIAINYPFYIKLGQKGTEKLLLKSLDRHLTTSMLNDYLNCGNSEIELEAKSIGKKHGYWISTSPGFHYGPKWRSGN
jgi:HEAT repeat protein